MNCIVRQSDFSNNSWNVLKCLLCHCHSLLSVWIPWSYESLSLFHIILFSPLSLSRNISFPLFSPLFSPKGSSLRWNLVLFTDTKQIRKSIYTQGHTLIYFCVQEEVYIMCVNINHLHNNAKSLFCLGIVYCIVSDQMCLTFSKTKLKKCCYLQLWLWNEQNQQSVNVGLILTTLYSDRRSAFY